MSTSKFQKFTQNDYDAIYQKLNNSEVKVLTDKDAKDVNQLPLDIVTVNLIQ